ncbi:uncharacterized protein LOC127283579 [Leptopilina boulardi]|uniref:uncharacterized protein LOC127283579 n=1 Tax=Leptopilina boulardi TaxID=63433 RepID=UPI0021F54FD6|nr:uncharacterized protein LOC127283579 [Leptopilina boulardi]XP_051164506.1 uncharacterized protein LOC127283579 [Leptopilina boulardi]
MNFENFSVEELAAHLRNEIDEETIEILKDQQIDGSSFLELTLHDLVELMKIKIGPAKKIQKIIKENHGFGIQMVEEVREFVVNPQTGALIDIPQAKINVLQASQRVNRPSTSSSTVEDTPFSKYKTVRETLEHHAQGIHLINVIDKGQFGEEDRRALVRILVSELINEYKNLYPPDDAKWALAKAIVREFPSLREQSREASAGCEHFFDKNTRKGFIEFRLWNARKVVSPSKKKYVTKNVKNSKKNCASNKAAAVQNLLSSEELEEKISWMQLTMPRPDKKRGLCDCLMETFDDRRNWIVNENPTIHDIMSKYPRLFDFHGEMIELEFTKLFNEELNNNFLACFPANYTAIIIGYCKVKRPDIFRKASILKDENWKALAILDALLPTSNFAKKRKVNEASKGKKKAKISEDQVQEKQITDVSSSTKVFPNPDLIRILPEGTKVTDYIQNVIKEASGCIQPYVICVTGQKIDTYFIQLDGKLIEMDSNAHPIIAFDILFKIHFITNVHFSNSLFFFYNFVEHYVYKGQVIVKNSVASLHSSLNNFKEQ